MGNIFKREVCRRALLTRVGVDLEDDLVQFGLTEEIIGIGDAFDNLIFDQVSHDEGAGAHDFLPVVVALELVGRDRGKDCLLYTSDAADE